MRGFSLIELMVVIAIVAVLAALSVTSYQDYMARSRVAAFWPILDSVKGNALDYFTRNNTWPNATQLGFTSADDMDLDDPTTLNEYFTVFTITPATTGGCTANILTVVWTLDHEEVGIGGASTYTGYLYVGEMPNGYIASMCRETLDGSTFGHTYIGDVCTYNDIASFNMAICS